MRKILDFRWEFSVLVRRKRWAKKRDMRALVCLQKVIHARGGKGMFPGPGQLEYVSYVTIDMH